MEEKKNWLKENRWPKVLESLRPFLEESSVDAQAPVRGLLSLYLQPLEFPGLQKRAGGGPAHRFGGD